MITLLKKVQQELKAPKAQLNKFGGYKYRSCEDILEAVKPILGKNNLVLTLTDEAVCVGNRNYIKATATLHSEKGTISTSAFACEEETKKGMDASQISGAASSYARKYALNGLFCIDDTKDADALNEHNEYQQALDEISQAKSLDDLRRIYSKHKELYNTSESFKDAVQAKRTAIENGL